MRGLDQLDEKRSMRRRLDAAVGRQRGLLGRRVSVSASIKPKSNQLDKHHHQQQFNKSSLHQPLTMKLSTFNVILALGVVPNAFAEVSSFLAPDETPAKI